MRDGVTKLVPVPAAAPPLETVYHFSVPPTHPDADKLTVPGPHLGTLVAVGAIGKLFVVTAIKVLGLSQFVVVFTWLT